MNVEIIGRIGEIMSHYGLSERAFSIELNINQKTLNNQMRGRNTLSVETITAIASSFEDISMDWLIKGEGTMMYDHTISLDKQGIIRMYSDLLEARDKKIRDLEQQIIELESKKLSV